MRPGTDRRSSRAAGALPSVTTCGCLTSSPSLAGRTSTSPVASGNACLVVHSISLQQHVDRLVFRLAEKLVDTLLIV
jgi:hypothetical protein